MPHAFPIGSRVKVTRDRNSYTGGAYLGRDGVVLRKQTFRPSGRPAITLHFVSFGLVCPSGEAHRGWWYLASELGEPDEMSVELERRIAETNGTRAERA